MNNAAWVNKTSSAACLTGGGYLYAASLTAGSDAATMTVYDNTEASGTIIVKLAAAAGTSVTFAPDARLPVSTGIYAALTGTTPSVTIVYAP